MQLFDDFYRIAHIYERLHACVCNEYVRTYMPYKEMRACTRLLSVVSRDWVIILSSRACR